MPKVLHWTGVCLWLSTDICNLLCLIPPVYCDFCWECNCDVFKAVVRLRCVAVRMLIHGVFFLIYIYSACFITLSNTTCTGGFLHCH
jgi:hypothetical protein